MYALGMLPQVRWQAGALSVTTKAMIRTRLDPFWGFLPVLALLVLLALSARVNRSSLLEIEMQVDGGSSLQVFWTPGNEGFKQERSATAATIPGKRRLYRLRLPTAFVSGLRLDPSDMPFSAEIYSIRVETPFFSELWDNNEGFVGWSALQNIAAFEKNKESLVATSVSNDGAIATQLPAIFKQGQYLICALYFFPLLLVMALHRRITEALRRIGIASLTQRLSLSFRRLAHAFYEEHVLPVSTGATVIICAVIFLFALSVSLRLHGSSIGMWEKYLPDERQSAVLLGTPRSIRSDEWLVGTPFILSQINHHPPFPLVNSSIGAIASPLVAGIPVMHISSIFRPQHWGFFLLPPEYGYAFWWDFKFFALFLGLFVLLLMLTRGKTFISFCAAVWFLYSSFTQWWFSANMPDIVLSFLWGLIGLFWLWHSRRSALMLIGAILCTLFATDFILALYPPFQVPLFYLALFIAVAHFSEHHPEQHRWKLRACLTLGSMFVVALVVISFYHDAYATIERMQRTVYPGQRHEAGGGFSLVRYFSGFLDLFLNDSRFPRDVGNICEASSFLLLWPVVACSMAVSAWREKRLTPVLSALLFYLAAVSCYLVTAWPPLAAKMTLFSLVPSGRAMLGVGLANVLIVSLWLAREEQPSTRQLIAFMAPLLIAVLLYANGLSHWTEGTVPAWQVWLSALSLILLALLLFAGKTRAFCYVLVLHTLVPNFLVNTITQGLGSLTGTRLFQTAQEIAQQYPDKSWASADDFIIAGAIKAAGAPVLNGAKFAPDLEMYSQFDPRRQNEAVYNRYAHLIVHNGPTGGIPSFSLQQADLINLTVPLCALELKNLNVDYFVLPRAIEPAVSECLSLQSKRPLNAGFWLYQRKPG